MKAILDAGVFLQVEKHDRRVGAMLRDLQRRRVPVHTSSAVVAQVWRDGRRQARIAQLLGGVKVRGLAPDDDRRTGELLALSRTNDLVDAHVALLAEDDDVLLTSDPRDLDHLVRARRVRVNIVSV